MSYHSTRRLMCQACIEGVHRLCERPESCVCPCQEADFKLWSEKVRAFLAEGTATDYAHLPQPIVIPETGSAPMAAFR
jgi:hypothetical protein